LLREAHAVFMDALGSTEWTTVVVITMVAHAFRIKLFINVWALIYHVLLAFFRTFRLWFFIGFCNFLVDRAANTLSILYRGSTAILFNFFTYLLGMDLCLLGGFSACLRLKLSQFLSHCCNILKKNLQNIFLNFFLSGYQIIGPKSRFEIEQLFA